MLRGHVALFYSHLQCCCCCRFCCRIQAAAAHQLIEQNFAPAVQASIARMQNMIESASYNLKKQEVKRAAVAGQQ
jgi:hypothetical protein